MKITLLILSFIIHSCIAIWAQNLNTSLNDRAKFISIKTLNENQRLKIIEEVAISNDTLVRLRSKISDEDKAYLCNCFKNDTVIRVYRNIAFTRKTKGHRKLQTSQWNSEIMIYFDPKFSKQIIKDFKVFFKPIQNLNNLKINYTTKVNEANYHIKISEGAIGDDDSEEKEPFSKATYNLVTDSNYKYYAGKIFIDLENIKDKSLVILKLKQLFFNSLGHFQLSYIGIKTDSLSNAYYINSDFISETDISLLKLHYFKIHNNTFDEHNFLNLEQELRKTCYND